MHDMCCEAQSLADEPTLGFPPVRADMYDVTEILTDASRIRYAKIYKLEHNLPIAFIGEVVPDDLETAKDRVLSACDGDVSGRVGSSKESQESHKSRKHSTKDKKSLERLKKT